jgi:hypothetical protein
MGNGRANCPGRVTVKGSDRSTDHDGFMSLNLGPFPRGLLLYPEEGGTIDFRNICKFLIEYTRPHHGTK